MYISLKTIFIFSYVLIGIAAFILLYLFGHSDQENKALNIICLALFAVATVLITICKVIAE